jgi:hypothetical protein
MPAKNIANMIISLSVRLILASFLAAAIRLEAQAQLGIGRFDGPTFYPDVVIGKGGAIPSEAFLVVCDSGHAEECKPGALITDYGWLELGNRHTPGNAGKLTLRQDNGDVGISMSGKTGDVTNMLDGNGPIKAWCRIKADGTYDDGFRCNSDPNETRKIGAPGAVGWYKVDFTALSTDISSRPHIASCSNNADSVPVCKIITSHVHSSDLSSLFVTTRDINGNLADASFTVALF